MRKSERERAPTWMPPPRTKAAFVLARVDSWYQVAASDRPGSDGTAAKLAYCPGSQKLTPASSAATVPGTPRTASPAASVRHCTPGLRPPRAPGRAGRKGLQVLDSIMLFAAPTSNVS